MADLGHPFSLVEGVEVEQDDLLGRLLAKYRLVPRDIEPTVLRQLDLDIRAYLKDRNLAVTMDNLPMTTDAGPPPALPEP